MRPLFLALTVSVAVNLGLLGAFLRERSVRRATPAETAVPAAAAATTPAGSAAAAPRWSVLNRDDQPSTLVERLRRAGFPSAVVRQVAMAIVAERFEAERARVDPASLNPAYWKKWPESWLDPKIGPELRRLRREEEVLLKRLLGDEAQYETQEQRAWVEQQYGGLNGEKMQRVQALQREYNEKTMALISAAGGGKAFVASDGEKVRAMEREMRTRLAEFLTPDEINEFNMRNGEAANILKFQLGPSQVTESEFRALVPLYEAYRQQFSLAQPYGSASHLNPEQAAARTLASDAFTAQVTAALGASRAEELKLALNPQFAHVARFTNRLNLPIATTRELHVAGVAAVEQIDRLNADKSLTTEQRNARLQAVGKEGAERIAAVLRSEDAIRAYHIYTHSWLINLGKPKP